MHRQRDEIERDDDDDGDDDSDTILRKSLLLPDSVSSYRQSCRRRGKWV